MQRKSKKRNKKENSKTMKVLFKISFKKPFFIFVKKNEKKIFERVIFFCKSNFGSNFCLKEPFGFFSFFFFYFIAFLCAFFFQKKREEKNATGIKKKMKTGDKREKTPNLFSILKNTKKMRKNKKR
jgi:hypothetical protein